jgi:hypothetical protein
MKLRCDQMNNRICNALKVDGDGPCRTRAQKGSDLCYFHDRTKAEERRAAQARGGKGKRRSELQNGSQKFNPKTVADFFPLLVATINGLLLGDITPKVATTLCNLINTGVKLLSASDLEGRLNDLEQAALKIRQEKVEDLFDPAWEGGSEN